MKKIVYLVVFLGISVFCKIQLEASEAGELRCRTDYTQICHSVTIVFSDGSNITVDTPGEGFIVRRA